MPDRKPSPSPPPPSPGLAARRVAVDIVSGVLRQKRPLDDLLEQSDLGALPERDRALVRTIVATVLRRLGTLRHLLAVLLERGLPKSAPKVEDILLIGAAQILFLDVPDHASVDLSVRLAQADHHASHYSGLVNARAAKARPRRQSPSRRARHHAARYPGLADAALDRALRPGDGARDRRGAHPGAGARPDGEKRSGNMGGSARRPRARHRHGADDCIGPDPAAARLRRRRMVGAGRRRRLPARNCSATSAANPSPIFAPRPAARPRNWRWPARR